MFANRYVELDEADLSIKYHPHPQKHFHMSRWAEYKE